MKKVPIRKCLSCKEHFEKKELLRIVKTPTGEILVDSTGKVNGRGAYICKSQKCLDTMISKKALQRVFSSPISDEVIEDLKNQIEEV